ncbi:uncharacterized protein LOC141906339 [Tubulanus polymorphus]|uniref:uncharacterized protein LOC141906339 n=1 Tax=Tubulanus polymorphus TaxID=672921 RepID=UPI003DA5671E
MAAANSNSSIPIDKSTSTSNDICEGLQQYSDAELSACHVEKHEVRSSHSDVSKKTKLECVEVADEQVAVQEICTSNDASTQTAEQVTNNDAGAISSSEDIQLRNISPKSITPDKLEKPCDIERKQRSSEKLRTRSSSSSGSQRSEHHLHRLLSNLSALSDGPFCRICHEGNSKEDLFSPCKCSGTMGLIHRSCIETWLGSSNSNKCEICNHVYTTRRYTRPFYDWLRYPTTSQDRKNLIADTVCFVLLTPLAVVSAWLCITGALHYSSIEGGNWEAIGLIGLTCFLLLIYLVWCSVAIRYHVRIWVDWRNSNQRVTVVDFNAALSSATDDENNNNTQLQNLSSLSPISSSSSVNTDEIIGGSTNNCRTCSHRRRFNDRDFRLLPVVILNQEYSLLHDSGCPLNASFAIPLLARINAEREVVTGKRSTIAQWRDSEAVCTVPRADVMANTSAVETVMELSPTASGEEMNAASSTPSKRYHYYQSIDASPIKPTQSLFDDTSSSPASSDRSTNENLALIASNSSDITALLPDNKDSRRIVRETVV